MTNRYYSKSAANVFLRAQDVCGVALSALRNRESTYPLAAYLSGKGFDLYRNTALHYLPTGEAYLEDTADLVSLLLGRPADVLYQGGIKGRS